MSTLSMTEDYYRVDETPKQARQFINDSLHTFTDISSEAERVYNFGSKGFVKIAYPLKLAVSDSGGHRLFSSDGKSHYIPAGWLQLTWTPKPDHPSFVK